MISFDALYELETPTDVAVAPDGDRIAVVTRERSETDAATRNVVSVVPADGERQPHRITRASEAASPSWSPDGSKLAVLAAREEDRGLTAGRIDDDEAGDEEGNESEDDEPEQQVWIFDLERGGDPRQVTDREEGVRSFDWGPDGEHIVVASRDPTEADRAYLDRRREDEGPLETERLQHVAEGVGYLDAVRTYLFVVDVHSGETRRLDDAYGRGAREPIAGLQPAWSDGGIAYTTYRGPDPDDTLTLDVHVVDPETGSSRPITDGNITAAEPRWGPDGDRIAVVAGEPENFYAPRELYVLDPDSGRRVHPTEDLDVTLSRYGNARWIDSDRLLASLADRGTTRLLSVPAAGTGDPRRLPPSRTAFQSVVGYDVAGGTVAALVSDPSAGMDCYATSVDDISEFDPADQPLGTRVTTFAGPLVDDWPDVEVDRIRVGIDDADGIEPPHVPSEDWSGDGPDHEGGSGDDAVSVESLLTTPVSDSESADSSDPPYPTIVRLHGGPMSYDHPEFDFVTRAFASRGYAVLQPNFRGSISYGQSFAESLRGQWGTHDVEDVMATVDAAIESGAVDPDRLFVTGFSYGGILTGHLVTRTDRFVAGAAEHGIYDATAAFGSDDSHNWLESEFGLPWETPDPYEISSSLPDVERVETPLLITAGERDRRCPPGQADRLFVSLKKLGVPARLVRYDEGHEVTAPDRAVHRLEELCRWFQRFDPEVETAEIDPRYCEGGVE